MTRTILSGGVGYFELGFSCSNCVSGDTLWVDGVQVEQTTNLGSYFNGSTPGATWTGTANASTSSLILTSTATAITTDTLAPTSAATASPYQASTSFSVPFTAGDTGGVGSWVGQYYANMTLSGSPAITRTDPAINFHWGNGSPDPAIPTDGFSVRWTGTLTAATAGTYNFATTTDDGVRLKVDGTTVIDHWVDQGVTTWPGSVSLSAGSHTVVMEYYENGGGADAVLALPATGVWLTDLYESTSATPTSGYANVGTQSGTSGTFPWTAPGQGTYYFYSLATDNAGNVEAAPDAADASTILLAAPSALAVTATAPTTASFSWAYTGPTVDGFKVYDNTNTLQATAASGDTSVTASGLTGGSAYTGWYVVAYVAAGNGPASNTLSFQTSSAEPTSFVATGTTVGATPTSATASFSWVKGAGSADGFRIFNASGVQQGPDITPGNATTATVNGLPSGAAYAGWYVKQIWSGTVSAASNTVSFTTPSVATSAPALPMSGVGISGLYRLTNLLIGLVFTGTSDPNAAITLWNGAIQIGTGTATATGDWSVTTSVAIPANATSAIAAQANGGLMGDATNVTTDTIAPTSAAAPVAHSASRTISIPYTASDTGGHGNTGTGLLQVELWSSSTSATSGFALAATDLTGSTYGSFSYIAPADGSYWFYTSATDATGTVELVPATVTTNVDTVAPVVTVPSNINAEATGSSGAVVTFSASASDVVDGALTPVCSPASGTTFPLGDTLVTCAATDAAGNIGTASFTITIVDTTAPVVTVPSNRTVEATGSTGASTTFSASASDAVSGSLGPVCVPASGSTFPLGATTVTCSATDAAANTGSASFTVTVVDTTAPIVSAPSNRTVEATGSTGSTVSFSASASDAVSGSLAAVCSPVSGSTFPLGTTTVTCSATDGAANTGSATFTVTVSDTTAPVVSVPVNRTVEATGESGAVVSFSASASDAVSSSLTTVCSPASGSTFPLGDTLVTCAATDGANNTGSASFTVTVVDTTAPVVTVPTNRVVEATAGSGATAAFTATALDTVSGSTSTTCSPASGSTFPLGDTLITCSATDAAQNTGTASFTITVSDGTAPVVTVPSNINAEATGSSGAVLTFSASALDVVDGSLTTVCSPASGSTFPLGDTLVTCSATDAASNTGTASFTITVSDGTAPVVAVPSDMTVGATGASGAVVTFSASASDVVDGALTPVCSPASGSTFPLGDTLVTCSATDAASNTGSASFTITVSDTLAPVSAAGPAAGDYQTSTTISVPWTASDVGTGVASVVLWVSYNGGTADSAGVLSANPATYIAPGHGSYSFYTIATDAHGNVEAVPAAVDMTVVVDSGVPEGAGADWTFAGTDPHFSGATITTDPTAPSGDGSVILISSGSVTSDTVPVTPGTNVTVAGTWRLDGHGTTIELCFVGGGCPSEAALGDLTGTITYAIPWIEFGISAPVPTGATGAYLRWTVASTAAIDSLDWNAPVAPPADGSGSTQVVVDETVTVDAPGMLDFGSGLPGDVKTISDAGVQVMTNATAGYTMTAAADSMTSSGTDTIPATALSARPASSGSYLPFGGDIVLRTTHARTDETGERVGLDFKLTVPFVASDTYTGSVTFTITTN